MTVAYPIHDTRVPHPNPRVEAIELDRLPADALDGLIDELYAVHRRVFRGVDRALFRTRTLLSPAGRSRLIVLRGEHDEMVGYFVVHYLDRRIDHRRVLVADDEFAVLPEYRRHRLMQQVLASELLWLKLHHPLRTAYVSCCVVNPIVYYFLASNVPRIYPNPYGPTPWRIRRRRCSVTMPTV